MSRNTTFMPRALVDGPREPVARAFVYVVATVRFPPKENHEMNRRFGLGATGAPVLLLGQLGQSQGRALVIARARRRKDSGVAATMGATAFVGRCMFAFVFLASAVNKLQTLSDPIAGAATLASIAPRLAAARALFASKIGFPLYLVLPFTDGQLLLLGTLTEGVGAVLFVADSSLGAKMLMLFTLVVTPVMHAFWLIPDKHSAGYQVEMIMFYKNVAMFGALLFWHATRPVVVGSRRGGTRGIASAADRVKWE